MHTRLQKFRDAQNNKDGNKTIGWIENLIYNVPIADNRKLVIGIIISRYLINVKQLSYDETYNIIWNWLDKCAALKPLEPSSRHEYDRHVVNMQLKRALTSGRLPMRLETMKQEYPELYKDLSSGTPT